MKHFAITIYLSVDDEGAFYEAALKHATEIDGLSKDVAEELLKPDGEVDVGACVTMLFDRGDSPPGSEIHESNVELERDDASDGG